MGSKIESLSEEDVGITQYSSDHEGFFGIIKQRYSDFLVNEITPTGEVLHLTDIKTLPLPPSPPEDATCVTKVFEPPVGITSTVDAALKKLHQSIGGTELSTEVVEIDVDSLSKPNRKDIHLYIDATYKGLVSLTKDTPAGKVLSVSVGSAKALKIDKKRRTPKPGKYFTWFVMYKENMDTIEATSRLTSKLRVMKNCIAYAGTKDRRGKTVQQMSVSQVLPHQVRNAARQIHRMNVGNFSFAKKPLKLGQLGGNEFKIVLREVKGSDAVINTAVESVRANGVLNYYGLQRFGSKASPSLGQEVSNEKDKNVPHTHIIGKYILASKWDEAVKSILCPRAVFSDAKTLDNKRIEILQAYRDGSMTAAEALKALSGAGCCNGIEAQLLKGLVQHKGKQGHAPLMNLPRNVRTLYLHAYQAYLWNRVVSKRVEKYGLKVLPGDLVSAKTEDNIECEESDTGEATGEAKESEEAEDPAVDEDSSSGMSNKAAKLHSIVRSIAPEEVNSVNISQVLIPTIGYAVKMPDNELAEWYTEMLAEDGLTVADLNSKIKCFAVCGVYRRITLDVKNLEHKICYYTNPFDALVQSDIDVIFSSSTANKSSIKTKTHEEPLNNNVSGTVASDAASSDQSESDAMDVQLDENDSAVDDVTNRNDGKETEMKNGESSVCEGATSLPDTNGDGEHINEDSQKEEPMKAVVLQFSLPPAAYATMVLRELMKINTGSHFHASLNSKEKELLSSGKRTQPVSPHLPLKKVKQ